jgi:hypothetical protein
LLRLSLRGSEVEDRKVILSWGEFEELTKRAESNLYCVRHEYGWQLGDYYYHFLKEDELFEELKKDLSKLDKAKKIAERDLRKLKKINDINALKQMSIFEFLKWRKS